MSVPARTELLLAAHGAGDDSPANLQVLALAQRVGQGQAPSLRVGAAFRLGSPAFADAARQVDWRTSAVVPLMTSDGYFVRNVLPAALREGVPQGGTMPHVTPPIGLDPRVRGLFVHRLAPLLRQLHAGGGRPVVLVIGHGTARALGSGTSTYALVGEIRDAFPGVDARAAFLDQEPSLESISSTLVGRSILAVPFMLGGGSHALIDIPERLGIVAGKGSVTVLEPLAEHPELPGIVRSIGLKPLPEGLRLGTRTSPLALWQADQAADALRQWGIASRIVPISTRGDRDLEKPLEEIGSDSVFTDDLAAALRRGEIDVAVHSLKDLPLNDDPTLVLAAMLTRASSAEALVSARGVPLRDLPPGAVVGTCSTRRARQLQRLRPDIRTAPIRGDVSARIAQVRAGRFEATVLALAGLQRLGRSDEAAQIFDPEELLPEAGQGVITLQTRREDWSATAWCARADDPATRMSVLAEMAFMRRIEVNPALAAAAGASWSTDGGTLRVRVLSGSEVFDAVRPGSDPFVLADELAAAALASLEPRE